jgi:thioredoxin 1
MMQSILEEVKKELKDEVHIIKINVDKNQQAAAHFKISGVPTLMIFKGGQVVWRQSGVIPANQIISQIKSIA